MRIEVVAVAAAVVNSTFGRQGPHIQLHILLIQPGYIMNHLLRSRVWPSFQEAGLRVFFDFAVKTISHFAFPSEVREPGLRSLPGME
ncbi:MAG: hypothetical protein PVI73_03345 [Syntrophobacterales bacterium]